MSIEKLKGEKPCGGLRDTANEGLQPFIPISVLVKELPNHGFQFAIKSFHQTVCLWVINAGTNRFNAMNTMMSKNLFWDSYLGDFIKQLFWLNQALIVRGLVTS